MKSIKVTVKMHPMFAVAAGTKALGETCTADTDCTVPHAVCSTGNARVCQCAPNFSKIDALCGKFILRNHMVLRTV